MNEQNYKGLKRSLKSKIGYRVVGNFIMRRRRAKNISQQELANRLGYKSGQYISNVERGLCAFPISKVHLLSKILDIEVIQIVKAFERDTFEQIIDAVNTEIAKENNIEY